MKRLLPLLAALAAATLSASPAEAALTLCNRTSYVLYAATSAVAGPTRATRGWTRIAPGDCQDAIPAALTASAYYVYARSSLAHSGASRAWGGGVPICVGNENFTSRRPASAFACTSDSFDLPFAKLDTHHMKSWTMNFDKSPPLASLAAAQLAGAKRLLRDNGYKIGAIDGRPDKATEAAIAAFRKRMRFAPDAGNEALFDALETEALKTAAPAGYTVCNDTTDAILIALGEKTPKDWVSRGWWKIAAGGCARLLDALHAHQVDLLAQKPGGRALVAGPEKFCVTDIEFEIGGRTDCAARGLAEAGFAATVTHGLNGYAAHVGDTGLLAPPHRQSATSK